MKKLLMMLALSLVMVACNKEENNEILTTNWDNIISDITPIEVPVWDVLHSLQDNQAWVCRSMDEYTLNTKTNEAYHQTMVKDYMYNSYYSAGPHAPIRFVDGHCTYYYNSIPFTDHDKPFTMTRKMQEVDGDIVEIEEIEDDYEPLIYDIIAYDENHILVDMYSSLTEEYLKKFPWDVKLLYQRILFERHTSDDKWWETYKYSPYKDTDVHMPKERIEY